MSIVKKSAKECINLCRTGCVTFSPSLPSEAGRIAQPIHHTVKRGLPQSYLKLCRPCHLNLPYYVYNLYRLCLITAKNQAKKIYHDSEETALKLFCWAPFHFFQISIPYLERLPCHLTSPLELNSQKRRIRQPHIPTLPSLNSSQHHKLVVLPFIAKSWMRQERSSIPGSIRK